MLKLIVVPLCLLGLLGVYIQFEAPILRYVADNFDDGFTASCALSRLSSLGHKAIVVGRLESPSSRARLFAMRQLAATQEAELWTFLPILCEDSNEEVAREAVTFSGNLGVPGSVPAILRHFEANTKTNTVQTMAWQARCVEALAKIGTETPQVIEVLKANLSHRDHGNLVKKSLVGMKSKKVLPEYRDLVRRGDPEGPDAMAVLIEVRGVQEAEFFETLLRNRNPKIRAAAAEALATVKARTSVENLRTALNTEKDAAAKSSITKALTQLTMP